MENKINELKNKIWITRKSRINAEKRLLRKDKMIQYINIWYSIILTRISLYSISYEVSKIISITSVVISIGITMSLIYAGNQNFCIRAENMKRNYISLQKLEFDLDSEEEINNSKLNKFQNRYVEILLECENHEEIDYYEVLESQDKNIKRKYIFMKIKNNIIDVLFFVFPIILIILLFILEESYK